MRSDGVRRGVQAASGTRKPGSGPDLGRVSKMPGYGRRGTRRRRSHGDEHLSQRQRQQRRQLVAWSVGIGLVALAALVGVFIFWLYPRLQGDQGGGELALAAADTQSRMASKYKSPSRDEALALVKKALAMRSVDGLEALIRPGEMSPQEVVDFLAAVQAADGEAQSFLWQSSVDKNGLSLEGVQVNFADGEKSKRRLAFLTPDAKGVWKLDFAAFARCVKPSWKELLDGGCESGRVRVVAAKDNYYNGPFKDDRNWVAYKLVSPDIDEILVGYCRSGSAQHRAMELLWQRGEARQARVTLELHRPPDPASAERRQFEITHVLAEDWVMSDRTLDEGL